MGPERIEYGGQAVKSMNARDVRNGSITAVITYNKTRLLCPQHQT